MGLGLGLGRRHSARVPRAVGAGAWLVRGAHLLRHQVEHSPHAEQPDHEDAIDDAEVHLRVTDVVTGLVVTDVVVTDEV